jgi:hypothetical protein
MENPYSPPVADVSHGETAIAKSPKVIGIILIVLSSIAVIGILIGIIAMYLMPEILKVQTDMGLSIGYIYSSSMAGFLASLWSLYIGIQLVKYRDKGRKHFNIYLIYSIITGIGGTIYQWYAMQSTELFSTAEILPGIIGGLIGLILYLVFWYFLNKPGTKASLI